MKTRLKFVSNSSSSSFVVAVNKNKPSKVTLTIALDLEDYSDKVCETEEELLEYYLEENHVASLEELKGNCEYQYDQYLSALQEIKSGKTVYFGSFSSEGGDNTEQFLCENGLENVKSENMTIIYNEAGY